MLFSANMLDVLLFPNKKKVRWCSERQKTTTKNTQQLWTCIKEYMQYWESVDIEENALHVRSGIQWNTKGGWRKPLFGIIIMLKALLGLAIRNMLTFMPERSQLNIAIICLPIRYVQKNVQKHMCYKTMS